MAKWGKAFKRGMKAFSESFGPGEYTAAGKPIICDHCGSVEFAHGTALLDTAGMSLINLEWAGKSATTLACTSCGKIQWFLRAPQRVEQS